VQKVLLPSAAKLVIFGATVVVTHSYFLPGIVACLVNGTPYASRLPCVAGKPGIIVKG
jgi:hypothetical protein